MVDEVKIVKVFPKRIWAEKDFMGTVHIKSQHEGCAEFDFIQIQYDYAHTSNAHQAWLTEQILRLLGVAPSSPQQKGDEHGG